MHCALAITICWRLSALTWPWSFCIAARTRCYHARISITGMAHLIPVQTFEQQYGYKQCRDSEAAHWREKPIWLCACGFHLEARRGFPRVVWQSRLIFLAGYSGRGNSAVRMARIDTAA